MQFKSLSVSRTQCVNNHTYLFAYLILTICLSIKRRRLSFSPTEHHDPRCLCHVDNWLILICVQLNMHSDVAHHVTETNVTNETFSDVLCTENSQGLHKCRTYRLKFIHAPCADLHTGCDWFPPQGVQPGICGCTYFSLVVPNLRPQVRSCMVQISDRTIGVPLVLAISWS